MAQLIEVVEVNENNEVLRRNDINFAPIIDTIYDLGDSEDLASLKNIDEYGNTIFNHLQLKAVLSELQTLKQNTSNKDHVAEIDKLVEFIGEPENHKYIKFIGD